MHGLLWDLALADVPALDAYEEIGRGLYVKTLLPVIRAEGGSRQALVYRGRASEEGRPRRGYVENILTSGGSLRLPTAYLRGLAGILHGGTRGMAPGAAQGIGSLYAPVPGVRTRFATPFDRSSGQAETVGPKISSKARRSAASRSPMPTG